MLSQEDIEIIAQRLNKIINIPYMSEQAEELFLIPLVTIFDQILEDKLPPKLYACLIEAKDGFDDDEAKQLGKVLSERLASKIDIPYLTEGMERKVFRILINNVTKALRKNYTILDAKLEDPEESEGNQ